MEKPHIHRGETGAGLKEELTQAPCCTPHPGHINAPQPPKPQFRDVN